MSSPSGGIAGTPYSTDAQFRTMIRTIVQAQSPPAQSSGAKTPTGPNSFQQFQAKMVKYFGSEGQYWPEPGLTNLAKADKVSNDIGFKLEQESAIEENYVLAVTKVGTVQPYEDPGQAQAGIGPPSNLINLSGIGAWLVKNLTRIGEIIVGVVIVGVAVNAMLGNPAGKAMKATGK